MSLFNKPVVGPTLAELHAEAHALAGGALSLFHSVAQDLQIAAEKHGVVATQAQVQIDDATALRDAANQAAADATRQAAAVAQLAS